MLTCRPPPARRPTETTGGPGPKEALLTCVEDQYLPGVIYRARRIPTRLNAGFRVKTEAVFPPADLPTSASKKTTDPPARSKTKRAPRSGQQQ